MVIPAICGVWLKGLADRPGQAWPSPWVSIPLIIWCVGTGLPLFPGEIFLQMREFGLGTAATVIVWMTGVITLARQGREGAAIESELKPLSTPTVIAA
jgi:alpha-1,2-mannosyltransferase